MSQKTTVLRCPSCGRLVRCTLDWGELGVTCPRCVTTWDWRTGFVWDRHPPPRRRRGPRVLLIAGLLAAVGLVGLYGYAQFQESRLSRWSEQLAAARASLEGGRFQEAGITLGQIDAEIAGAIDGPSPLAVRDRMTRLQQEVRKRQQELDEARGRDLMRTAWSGQLDRAGEEVVRGDLAKADGLLREVEGNLARAVAGPGSPNEQERWRQIQQQTRDQRRRLDQARRQQETLATWGERLAEAARHLANEKFPEADDVLRQVESDLQKTTDQSFPPSLRGRLVEVRQKARAERQDIEERRYVRRLRSLLQPVRASLREGDWGQALRLLRKAVAEDGGREPVLQSILASLERRAGVAGGDRVFEEMIRDGPAWKSTRLADTLAAYQEFLSGHPHSPFRGEAEARVVDLEVSEIFRGDHGSLPPAEEKTSVEGRAYSVVNVANDTAYPLTLRYSGPDSFKVVFAAGEKGSVEVGVGSYKVTASVSAAHVRNYAGQEKSSGGNYEVTYYITGGFAPLPRPQIVLPGVREFERWPTKRSAPDYLK
jgi:hypothetical protein